MKIPYFYSKIVEEIKSTLYKRYAFKADRLYLHAESLEFTHPVSKEKVTIEVKADFTQQWLPQPKAEQSV